MNFQELIKSMYTSSIEKEYLRNNHNIIFLCHYQECKWILDKDGTLSKFSEFKNSLNLKSNYLHIYTKGYKLC